MKSLTLLIKPASGLCNMNCGYCFYRTASEGRENRIMSKETVDILLKKVSDYGPAGLTVIFQGGEPTLAGLQFFEYFTEQAKKRIKADIFFSIQTNGTLIDNKFADFFARNDYLVGISLDGNRKTNDRYRVDKHGESVLPATLSAINALKKRNVMFNILSVTDNENAADIDSTYAYFKKHGFYDLQFIPYVDEYDGISLSPEAYEAFLKRIFDLWYEDFDPDDFIQIRHIDNYLDIIAGFPPENCAMCGTCGHYYVIEANGDIFPCDFYCKEEFKIGHITDEKPFEINEKHKKFIEESILIRPQCAECKYQYLCRGGCKRDRINGFTENKYCKAYYNFFEYSIDRLKNAVKELSDD